MDTSTHLDVDELAALSDPELPLHVAVSRNSRVTSSSNDALDLAFEEAMRLKKTLDSLEAKGT
jgi:hypothetical protein